MATFTLTIELDNAAFADDPDELPAVLRWTADHVGTSAFFHSEGERVVGLVADTNGNTVGRWVIA